MVVPLGWRQKPVKFPRLHCDVTLKRVHGDNISLEPRYDINKVFTEEHEQILLKYYRLCTNVLWFDYQIM